MARTGMFGSRIVLPGQAWPARVGDIVISQSPRATGLSSHVAHIKRLNVRLDAATIVARQRGFFVPGTMVAPGAAEDQNFGATGGQHAAHAVKRYLFGKEDIVDVYARNGADRVAVDGLWLMLGVVTDVDRRANLSIDKRLEDNPQRVAQLQRVVDTPISSPADARNLARELELNRRIFEQALLRSMRGGFDGDANYDAMVTAYEATLSAAPPADERPEAAVDMMNDLLS